MHTQDPLDTASLVYRARTLSGLNQEAFAALLKRSQGVVSRYEAGAVRPPGDIIMRCMHIAQGGENPTVEALKHLRGAHAALEKALELMQRQHDLKA